MSYPAMWERIRRFRTLGRAEKLLFLRAFFLLRSLSLSLRLAGFRRTREFLSRRLPGASVRPRSAALEGAPALARIVIAAARNGPGTPTCLAESLALWWLLRREGCAAELRIGIRKPAGAFEAHAWVECNGSVLNDAGETHRHYARFDSSFGAEAAEPQ